MTRPICRCCGRIFCSTGTRWRGRAWSPILSCAGKSSSCWLSKKMKWLSLFALSTVLHPGIAVRDIDGVLREPLKVDKGHTEALFFVTNDCPVSNYYAHEIRRIC